MPQAQGKFVQSAVEGVLQGRFQAVHMLGQHMPLLPENLCRVAGRSRGVVGREVGDAVIDFMPDAREHGNGTAVHGAGHALVVEGPQILHRSAAADEHRHFGPAFAPHLFERFHDARRSVFALHGHGMNADFRAEPAR